MDVDVDVVVVVVAFDVDCVDCHIKDINATFFNAIGEDHKFYLFSPHFPGTEGIFPRIFGRGRREQGKPSSIGLV